MKDFLRPWTYVKLGYEKMLLSVKNSQQSRQEILELTKGYEMLVLQAEYKDLLIHEF